MTLIRKNYADWANISNLFDDFFSGDVSDIPTLRKRSTVPAVNIIEFADKFTIEIAAPGLKKDDFIIDLDNNVLTISSEKEGNEEINGQFTKREFFYANFKRAFTLPETADVEKIAAKYENGVLKLDIAKRNEAVIKPKRNINIQ
jgi:HSP20 family protein